MRNSSALDANISQWTAEHTAEDAMKILQDAGIAAGVVQNGIDICARDPQLKERGFWPTVSTAEGATTQVTGIPFKLSGTSGQVRTIAPEVGENTDYVLGELLGLTRAAQERRRFHRRRSMDRDLGEDRLPMAPFRNRDRLSVVGERSKFPHALSTDEKQRRTRREHLTMDRRAQRRRRNEHSTRRPHRGRRCAERNRHLRARSATEGTRLLANPLNREGRNDPSHRQPIQTKSNFRTIPHHSPRSRRK